MNSGRWGARNQEGVASGCGRRCERSKVLWHQEFRSAELNRYRAVTISTRGRSEKDITKLANLEEFRR